MRTGRLRRELLMLNAVNRVALFGVNSGAFVGASWLERVGRLSGKAAPPPRQSLLSSQLRLQHVWGVNEFGAARALSKYGIGPFPHSGNQSHGVLLQETW